MKKDRILPLDGLRGIAVLLVLGFHFLNNQYQHMDISGLNAVQKSLMFGTYFGWCGVDLFFVLSGFLIATILMKNRDSLNYFKTFYVRRFVRIIPIYYLLLLIFWVCKFSPWYTAEAYIFEKEIPIGYYFLFLQNFMMSSAGHFGAEALTPTWSLAIEEQFYLIIPFVIYYLKPKHVIYFVAFCLILGPISRYLSVNWYQQYTMLTSRIDSPAMGVLIAWSLQKKNSREYIMTHISQIKIISIFLLTASALIYVFSDPGILNHTLIALNFAFVVIIVLHTDKGFLYTFLTSKFLIHVGGISYFLYLYHQLINGLFHLIFLKHQVPILENNTAILVSLTALIVTWLLAILSFRYFESPLIKFSHKLKY